MSITDLDKFTEHPSYLLGDKVAEICAPLFSNFPVNYFCYTRWHKNSGVFLSSDKSWLRYYIQGGYHFLLNGKKIHSWSSDMSLEALAKATSSFNYHNGVMVEKLYLDYTETLEFASPSQYADPLEFCYNKDLLNQFFLYFKDKASHLIKVIEKYMKKSLINSSLFSDKIKNILNEISTHKIDINVNKQSEEYIAQNQIVDKGKELKRSLLEKYKDKYKNYNLKILIYSVTNGFWKYSFISWKQILNYMGVKVDIVYKIDPRLNYEDYDIYINIADKVYIDNSFANQSIMRIKNKIGLVTKQIDNEKLDLINIQLCKNFDYKFLISSLVEETNNKHLYNWVENKINIVNVPFGFNPLIYYPENTSKIYEYFFVGTNSYLKCKETDKYLTPILNKYKNGILRGAGWEKANLELNPNNSKFFYNRAKVNLNYHLDIQKQIRSEVNERTFIIGACGGFQLIDNPKIIYDLYTEDDMAIANDEYEYMKKFEYYLNKPLERFEKAYSALIKTYENNYSLFSRLEIILQKFI